MNQYNTLYLFPTPLWRANIKEELAKNNITMEDIVKECLDIEKKDKGRIVTNRGNNSYQSNNLDFSLENKKLKLYKLMQTVDLLVQNIYMGIWQGDIILANAWLNINRKGAFNVPHIHDESVLSGCIYLKVPSNSGSLSIEKNYNEQFIYSNIGKVKKDNPQPHITATRMYIAPEEGEVIVFPSHIPHQVDPNESDEDRISIAFNYVK